MNKDQMPNTISDLKAQADDLIYMVFRCMYDLSRMVRKVNAIIAVAECEHNKWEKQSERAKAAITSLLAWHEKRPLDVKDSWEETRDLAYNALRILGEKEEKP